MPDLIVTPSVSVAECGLANRTLAIVGSHPRGQEGVPWDDPNVDVMLMNEAVMNVKKWPRWDLSLQIHGEEVYTSKTNWVNSGYWEWLQQSHGKPIYMQEVDPRIPDSVQYPLDDVLAMIPYRYIRSSPAYCLALGIYLGYGKILIFGSELTSSTEYGFQATNMAFWIGFAHGLGVDLEMRCWLDEFEQPLYGYEGELQIDKDYFLKRISESEPTFKVNKNVMSKTQDRLSEAMLARDFKKVASLSVDLENAAMAAGELDGILAEAKRYASREDMLSRQEFERASAQGLEDGDRTRSEKDHAGGKAEYVWNTWMQTGLNEALNQLRIFLKEKTDLAYKCGRLKGIAYENLRYLDEYDSRLRAAGGKRALGRSE